MQIGLPVGLDRFVTSSAYVAFTRIVSPLGTIAIAANSFGITAESLCYMPGYGVQNAAVTLIGQSIGAKMTRFDLSLGHVDYGIRHWLDDLFWFVYVFWFTFDDAFINA